MDVLRRAQENMTHEVPIARDDNDDGDENNGPAATQGNRKTSTIEEFTVSELID